MKQEIAQRIQEEKEVKAMSNLNFFFNSKFKNTIKIFVVQIISSYIGLPKIYQAPLMNYQNPPNKKKSPL